STGPATPDPASCVRALPRPATNLSAPESPFPSPEPESVVTFKRAGLHVVAIPVTLNARYGGQSSITPLRSAYYMITVIMAILVGLLRPASKARGEARVVQ